VKNDTTSDRPLSPAPPCSCQDERQPAVVADTQTPTAESGPSNFDTVVPEHTIATASSVAAEATACLSTLGHADSRDILRLLHILRC
jgi:hypothetical protein